MTPAVIMQPEASPLTEGETAAAIVAVRDEVLALIASEIHEDPMSVELTEALYRIQPAKGLELEVVMHGLVDRVTRVSLN